jgi:hypothetical protein
VPYLKEMVTNQSKFVLYRSAYEGYSTSTAGSVRQSVRQLAGRQAGRPTTPEAPSHDMQLGARPID